MLEKRLGSELTACETLVLVRKLLSSPLNNRQTLEVLLNSNLIMPIVSHLKFSNSIDTKKQAAHIVNAIAQLREAKSIDAIATAGGIPALVALLSSSDSALLELVLDEDML